MPSVDVWPSEAWRQTHVYTSTHKLRCGMSHTRVLCHVEWTTRWDIWVVTTQTSRPHSFNVFLSGPYLFWATALKSCTPLSAALLCEVYSTSSVVNDPVMRSVFSVRRVICRVKSHTDRQTALHSGPALPSVPPASFPLTDPNNKENVRSDSCMAWPGTASKPWDKPWRMCRAFPTG